MNINELIEKCRDKVNSQNEFELNLKKNNLELISRTHFKSFIHIVKINENNTFLMVNLAYDIDAKNETLNVKPAGITDLNVNQTIYDAEIYYNFINSIFRVSGLVSEHMRVNTSEIKCINEYGNDLLVYTENSIYLVKLANK